MQLPLRVWSRTEMLKRVARFADLKGFSDGLQDSALPECEKTVLFVVGGNQPQNEFTPQAMKRAEEFARTGR
jgi:hypothetical protein